MQSIWTVSLENMPPKKRLAAVQANAILFGVQLPVPDSDDSEEEDEISILSSSSDSDDEPQNIHLSPTGFIRSNGAEWRAAEGTSPTPHQFSGVPGIQVDTAGFSNVDYIKLFLTDDIIQVLVRETNTYAQQYKAAHNLTPHSRVNRWMPTDNEEMTKFIATLWLMGFIRKPTLESYWTKDRLLSTPVFSNLMSRDRFTILLRFLHFNDNNQLPNGALERRKYMVSPITDLLNQRFKELYVPEKHISLDESLLKWLGNLSWKIFIPAKRARFGMKLYKLCCEEYTLAFKVYFGKDDTDYYPALPALGKTEKLVLYLTEGYNNKWYNIFLDRLYSSPQLFDELYQREIGACGTAMKGRKYMPKALIEKKMKKLSGEVAAVRNGPILALKYSDKKPVYILSTTDDHAVTGVPSRRKGQGIVMVDKPNAIIRYNKNMGGVDKTDQIINSYKSARKTMKWTKKLVLYLLQHATLNAHFAYKCGGGNQVYMQFMVEALHVMLQNPNQVVENRVGITDDQVRLTERHFIARIPPNPAGKSNPSKNCKVCTLYTHTGTTRRKDTTYYCPQCPSQPGLCIVDCFKRYHTVDDFKVALGM